MSREFGKAVVVIALVAGGLYAYERWHSTEPHSNPEPEPTTSVPVPSVPASADLSAEEDLIARPVIATVYECTGPAGRILSDKPCANDARTLQVRAPNGMDPTKIEIPEELQEGASASKGIEVVIPKLETCEQLNRSEALVNKRMRENPSEEYKKELEQFLREYAVTRKEWKCGRAR
jgi:hypothetical protein